VSGLKSGVQENILSKPGERYEVGKESVGRNNA